ncbi:MAG: ATP-dependent DNA helicase RecG [Bacteroidetes bacterium]|nr:ATP-dependent DNA helicase RecG [Bacteroidota bacterium]MBS1973679.1 ATP-dependent DNA helicase RecG [Bacteroidota bacterium]
MAEILSSPIEYLKGVGPQRGDLLKKELGIFTFRDLLEHFPYRHIDRTKINLISSITPQTDFIQVTGRVISVEVIGEKKSKRFVATIKDSSGTLDLVWFQGVAWAQKAIQVGKEYFVYGRAGFFQGSPQITHPEFEMSESENQVVKNFLEPVYPSSEKLKARGLGGRQFARLTLALLNMITEKDLPEILPDEICRQLELLPRFAAYQTNHFPANAEAYKKSLERLKFEELFIAQLRIGLLQSQRHRFSKGAMFSKVGEMFNSFYSGYLPFELTGAQKKVLKEIRKDTGSGKQMNRLLQGDVGSGKTIVALLAMLLAIDNGFQACMMAPTEILAKQHLDSMGSLLKDMPITVELLTGSTKSKQKKQILEQAANGSLNILIGTHAVIEDVVQFKNLGFAVIDEQHRFGVAQRARLWAKSLIPPHILVMTATPIPRTLAMTAYGDLDYSIMDELPPGRQPIVTVHRYESKRPEVMGFLKSEIENGRQVYIIFPLIEESEKMDYENLMKGYENVKAWFPEPKYWISMVHGRQSNEVKDTNMQRFLKHDTQIMVSTTVIEVGVNVPNATVMVIESAEKFGLSQLHQLRGRVGRGKEKSFCILLTSHKLNNEARERIKTMCGTNDGFKIAEKDLEIRGPGDISGTRQSGMLDFKLADIVKDRQLLETARQMAWKLLDDDPDLNASANQKLKNHLNAQHGKTQWSRIS